MPSGRCVAYIFRALQLLYSRLLYAAIVVPQLVFVTSALADGGFEDIAWGSLPEEIEEKFAGNADPDDELCNDEAATAALAEQGEDCLLLRVDHYFANGIDFSATFRFDSERQGLRMVVLTSKLKSKNLNPGAVRRMLLECRNNYDKISRRLTGQFGSPLPSNDVVGQPEPTFTKADYKAWTTEGTGVWMRRSYGYTDHWKRWRKADGCEIELRYFSTPVPGPDLAR
ncbi:MAG: hypothetical protein ABW205_03335 [Burkholderiales bacterium]